MILAQREMLIVATSEAKIRALEIERLKLMLAKARREMFGQSSERGKLLVEQLELAIEDLEETQAEEEAKAENAAPGASKDRRSRAPRGPRKLPDNLPVERVVEPRLAPVPSAAASDCASSARKCRRRSNAIRALEIVEHVREKFTCRIASRSPRRRRRLADSARPRRTEPARHGLSAKFLLHLPLNRQSAPMREKVSRSTCRHWPIGLEPAWSRSIRSCN